MGALGRAQIDVRQRARDGDLPIWGREGFSGTLNPLPPDYWEYYGFDLFGLMRGNAEEYGTELTRRTKSISLSKCRSLMTSKEKVEELWPPSGC